VYTEFFGLNEKPFSITPDPRYLYLSRRHADALAHLVYGISESGGFIQLTGEVGTGKTTLIRTLLQQLPEQAEIALILNPQLSAREFLLTICDELGTPPPEDDTARSVVARLNAHLLEAHAQGRRIVLIVDEAQTLGPELLEQVRLLTNLETPTQKLLQIILIGQPELREILQRAEMRQIAQRVTGRYHLEPLGRVETEAYVKHRLRVAGCPTPVFTPRALTELFRQSSGIPRLINVVADRALLAAYTRDSPRIEAALVKQAATEVFGRPVRSPASRFGLGAAFGAAIVLAGAAVVHMTDSDTATDASSISTRAETPAAAAGPAPGSARSAPDSAQFRARGAPTAPDAARAALDGAAGLPHRRNEAASLAAAGPAADRPSAAAPPPIGSSGNREPVPTLRKILAAHGQDASESGALAELFALWGADYDAARGAPCAQATAQSLRCLADARGSINELRTMNRPAVLTLREPAGTIYAVVLAGLDDETATLLIGGRKLQVGLSELIRDWYGRHLILWRPPKPGAKVLRRGSRDPEVVWLRQSLARIRGDVLEVQPSALYDAGLEAEVRQFQREHMLDDDGIAGARTQIAIITDLGSPGTPTLRKD
jgi:general secretion pathway protein A